jgi:hypothetical protein
MSAITLLAWALVCFFCAFVAFNGIRKSGMLMGFAAFVAMMILGNAGFDALKLLNLAMMAMAAGAEAPFELTGSVWSLASLALVGWFTPTWLLRRA